MLQSGVPYALRAERKSGGEIAANSDLNAT